MHPQPLIAVRDVAASRHWYQSILGFKGAHGGAEYEQLMYDDRMVMQLHRWNAQAHPHFGDPDAKPSGNGVVLWFQTENVEAAFLRATRGQACLLEPLRFNPNAQHREFWLRDPDGYVVVVAGAYGDTGA
jgi:catechol 2,3-dioxygenase-like lactoylglutathione lyase family enzyme